MKLYLCGALLVAIVLVVACGPASIPSEESPAGIQAVPVQEAPTPTTAPIAAQQEDDTSGEQEESEDTPEPVPTVCVRVRDRDGSALGPEEVEKDGVIFYCHELPNPTPKYDALGYYSQFAEESETATARSGTSDSTPVKERVFVRVIFDSATTHASAVEWLLSEMDTGRVTWMNPSDRWLLVDVDIHVGLLRRLSERDGFQYIGDAHKHYIYDPRDEPIVEFDEDGEPIPPSDISPSE